MSSANTKGGFNVTLRVTQNSSSESLCVLQKPLLKKAENWSLQVTDLFINKTPPLNRQLGEQFRIVPYTGAFSAAYRLSDYAFFPQNCFTIMEYVVQLQDFFRRFSFLFSKYGHPNLVGPGVPADFIAIADIATTIVQYTRENYAVLGEDGYFFDEGYSDVPPICSCSLNTKMGIDIMLTGNFLADFFIDCQDHFSSRLGMPSFIFAVDDLLPEDGVSLFLPGVAPQGGYAPFIFEVAARGVPEKHTWFSDYTVRELDDRISIDLVSTFPASRKIHVLDGKEEHEFILARFELSNLKDFKNHTFSDDDNMSTKTRITETYEAGIENLTRGNADYSSNLLLPGSLQQVHLMLFTRYLEHGKIKRVKTDMEDGFWHARILFSKKI